MEGLKASSPPPPPKQPGAHFSYPLLPSSGHLPLLRIVFMVEQKV